MSHKSRYARLHTLYSTVKISSQINGPAIWQKLSNNENIINLINYANEWRNLKTKCMLHNYITSSIIPENNTSFRPAVTDELCGNFGTIADHTRCWTVEVRRLTTRTICTWHWPEGSRHKITDDCVAQDIRKVAFTLSDPNEPSAPPIRVHEAWTFKGPFKLPCQDNSNQKHDWEWLGMTGNRTRSQLA
jgi:hypothetical protein